MSATIPTWVAGELVALDKLEAHRRGLLHKAVSVFVLCGTEVLIQRRAMTKYHTPGLWANTCCTHPHWDEAPERCAHRRLWEELGLSGLALEHRGQVTYRAAVGGGLTGQMQPFGPLTLGGVVGHPSSYGISLTLPDAVNFFTQPAAPLVQLPVVTYTLPESSTSTPSTRPPMPSPNPRSSMPP